MCSYSVCESAWYLLLARKSSSSLWDTKDTEYFLMAHLGFLCKTNKKLLIYHPLEQLTLTSLNWNLHWRHYNSITPDYNNIHILSCLPYIWMHCSEQKSGLLSKSLTPHKQDTAPELNQTQILQSFIWMFITTFSVVKTLCNAAQITTKETL